MAAKNQLKITYNNNKNALPIIAAALYKLIIPILLLIIIITAAFPVMRSDHSSFSFQLLF